MTPYTPSPCLPDIGKGNRPFPDVLPACPDDRVDYNRHPAARFPQVDTTQHADAFSFTPGVFVPGASVFKNNAAVYNCIHLLWV